MHHAETLCSQCVHYVDRSAGTFYCKLLEDTYSENQSRCEDFEDAQQEESTAYECD